MKIVILPENFQLNDFRLSSGDIRLQKGQQLFSNVCGIGRHATTMNTMSSADDAMMEVFLRDFCRQLHSTFPLRNFTEFYDDEKCREKILQLKENVSKTFFSKVWNREEEEVVSLVKKLRERMNREVIADWTTKNERHKIQSVSYLQKKTEMLCGDFQMALEDQLLLNPEMEMDSLKNYVERGKLFAVSYFDGIWNHGNNLIKEERRVKMVKYLDAIGEEVFDKHKHVLKRKSVDKGNKLLDEVKTIIMEKSRQLKSYIESRPKRLSKQYLKVELEDMYEYLLNGKGSTLRESEMEIYLELVSALESGVKFLSEERTNENDISSEDVIEWVEGLDLKLNSFWDNEGAVRDDARRTDVEGKGCDSSDRRSWISMQQLLNEDPFGFREQGNREPGRRHEDDDHESLIGYNECEEREAIRMAKESIFKADDFIIIGPAPATKKRTRLRSSCPLNSSATVKGQKINTDHSHDAKHDGPLPKKGRSCCNVSRKTGTKVGGNVHRQNSAKPAQAKSSRSSRLRIDMTEESTGETAIFPNQFSSSRPDNESTIGTDTLKHSKPKRSQSKSGNTAKSRSAPASGKSSEPRHSDTFQQTHGLIVTEHSEDCDEKNSEIDMEVGGRTGPALGENTTMYQQRRLSRLNKTVNATVTTQSRRSDRLRKNSNLSNPTRKGKVRVNANNQSSLSVCGVMLTGGDETTINVDTSPLRPSKSKSGTTGRFVNHTRTHTGGKPYKCPTCDKRFTHRHNLNIHIRSHIDKAKARFTCEKCKKGFSSRYNLNRHKLNHEGTLPFGCSYCDERRNDMTQLMAHVLTHSDERPYNCVTCTKQFGRKDVLLFHIQRIHRQSKEDAEKQANEAALEYLKKVTNNPNYDGDISNSVVLSNAVKKANLKIPDGTDMTTSAKSTTKKEGGCPNNSNRLEQITILQEHPFVYKCNVCGIEIRRKCIVKYHGKNCNISERKCQHCGKQFLKMFDLVAHLRIHTGEKPFHCPTCSKQFSRKCNLKAHTRTHAKPLFICEKCKKGFRFHANFKCHMLKHEGELPFGCSYCDHRCVSMTRLRQHVIMHCDERPYICPICDKSFSWKVLLFRHIQGYHHQAKEDAMKLANEAGVNYLRKENQIFVDTGSCYRIESSVLSHAIKKANLKLCEPPSPNKT